MSFCTWRIVAIRHLEMYRDLGGFKECNMSQFTKVFDFALAPPPAQFRCENLEKGDLSIRFSNKCVDLWLLGVFVLRFRFLEVWHLGGGEIKS